MTLAASTGNLSVARWLVDKKGGDVNATNTVCVPCGVSSVSEKSYDSKSQLGVRSSVLLWSVFHEFRVDCGWGVCDVCVDESG